MEGVDELQVLEERRRECGKARKLLAGPSAAFYTPTFSRLYDSPGDQRRSDKTCRNYGHLCDSQT